MTCTYAQKSVSIMKAAYEANAENLIVSEQDFLMTRNHMLVIMAIVNAARSGVLRTLTKEDIAAGMADRYADSRTTIFSVAKHKTSFPHEAATVGINKEETTLLKGYLKIRDKYFENRSPPDYVFLTHFVK